MIRRFFIAFAVGFVCMFGATVSYACTSDEIDVLGDGTQCETAKFTVTTTNISANTTFLFAMSAKGTFYVDCGTGGTLNGTGVSGKKITRSNTTSATYTCRYTTAGVKTIRFGGIAGTAANKPYSTAGTAVIRFNSSSSFVAGISGSLGAIFPTRNATYTPKFRETFSGCTNLTGPLPANLFDGVTGTIDYMFYRTFYNCSKLTGYIPADMFDKITSYSNQMMTDMFYGTGLDTTCSGTTVQYTTGFEEYWNGKVSCTEPFVTPIVLDAQAATTTSAPTTVYLKYGIGWYSDLNATTSISALTTNPTKINYNFDGYWTSANGAGTQVIDENGDFIATDTTLRVVKITDASKTIYANWTRDYNVMYSCGDGTGTPPASATATLTKTFALPANTCARDGYMFVGWLVSGTSDVKLSDFVWNYTGSKTFTAQWAEEKFTLTTTEIADGGNFQFTISAKGTFYVDCGAGGTLSSSASDVSGVTITRSNPTGGATTPYPSVTYTCTYTTAGIKTIRFGGIAGTGNAYPSTVGTAEDRAAIRFYKTRTLVAGISGSLGAIFPSRGTGAAQQPQFFETFYDCTNLTGTIPDNLFSGVTGIGGSMFLRTFSGCTGLTGSIPENLFSGITGAPAQSMFSDTFRGCSGLTGSIPENLFSGISGKPAQVMFSGTFYGCSGLTGSIPENLFGGISGAPAPSMFADTFYGCSGLTGSIPENLFSGISGAPASSMFRETFYGCSGLTGSIPENLFSGISGAPASGMFSSTFYGCSGLTGSIPENLFADISGAPAYYMFEYTFSGCSGLTGSIPADLFADISGAPASSMFRSTFYGCSGLTGSIPENLFSGISGAGAGSMFISTFYGCSNLSGYVPKGLFENITSTGSAGVSMTFTNTNLYTECPCGTRPAETGWGATVVDGRAVCEVGTKDNEHWNNGVCITDCALGFSKLKSSTGLEYPILSVTTTDHNINLSVGNGVCHVPLANGAANNNINVSFGGATYHATVPDEIVPTGFTGQPAPVEPD